MKKLSIMLAGMLFVSQSSYSANWGYSGEHSPDHWGEIAAECANGVNQSPINIQGVIEAQLPKVALDYQGEAVSMLNNGHTLQVNVHGKNELTLDGHQYELKQFHFHTPSENLLEGQSFPLEMHLVHADKQGKLVVVAMFFKLGDGLPALTSLLQDVPKRGSTQEYTTPINMKHFMPAMAHYYRFNGSLTTPPCSEGVTWLVATQSESLSAAQLTILTQMMGKNNRPIQPLNARLVLAQ